MTNYKERIQSSHAVRPTDIEDFLRKIEVFKNFPRQSIQVIDKQIIKKSYKKGEQIISEYDEAQGVFFVHSGIVKLTKQDEEGNEIIVCMKKKGDIFAEACLFNQAGSHYPATAKMVKDGEISFLNTVDLEYELMLSPELSIEIIRYMSAELREMISIMRDLALLDVYTKTLKTLERLAAKFGATRCNRMHIELPITVQEFASLVGTSRESVSRVFSKLRKDGIIDVRSKEIVIIDWCRFCSLFHSRL
ncbi:Crp/Fnr family transcriptional regulator [Bacillus canaveralius]|uniref:Crp/Fnr family transcriptional regulator n=1 Tax=Bacillus canaveralius TaxID=1403243 RepID=A0A2N5GJW3_9BACI|nr:Crp/Fnr family transcriptional regulator [Bacillus canaveralius]PLR81596.1 Crp/Fnr family transcriptional regulator [Bacillus canaveralius]PLR90863.1 Crp/Fnr family transcriptional regulator [Bacillus canaveralius]